MGTLVLFMLFICACSPSMKFNESAKTNQTERDNDPPPHPLPKKCNSCTCHYLIWLGIYFFFNWFYVTFTYMVLMIRDVQNISLFINQHHLYLPAPPPPQPPERKNKQHSQVNEKTLCSEHLSLCFVCVTTQVTPQIIMP